MTGGSEDIHQKGGIVVVKHIFAIKIHNESARQHPNSASPVKVGN